MPLEKSEYLSKYLDRKCEQTDISTHGVQASHGQIMITNHVPLWSTLCTRLVRGPRPEGLNDTVD
jgi:hypothetical protein